LEVINADIDAYIKTAIVLINLQGTGIKYAPRAGVNLAPKGKLWPIEGMFTSLFTPWG
jgi:hypothetical protein